MFKLGVCVMATAIGLFASGAMASEFVDDFGDNNPSPDWIPAIDNPSQLTITETDQRVEVTSTGAALPTDDAIFLSNALIGNTVDTASDFQFCIELTLDGVTWGGANGDEFGFIGGVGDASTPGGENSAALTWGFTQVQGIAGQSFALGYRVNDVETVSAPQNAAAVFGPVSGMVTVTVTYDSDVDLLTFDAVGPGINVSFPLAGVVQGQWGASELVGAFGARGTGLVVGDNQAYFDNFDLKYIPEPTTLALVAMGGLAMLRRRRA